MTILQINLHHSKAASAALLLHLAESGADVALIQEPWILGDRILGLGASKFRLCKADTTGKKRACILAKKNLNLFLLPNFSNEDHVAAAIESPNGPLRICSAYMGHDQEALPPHPLLKQLVEDSKKHKIDLIIGKCTRMYSDNGTNFIGARRSLYEMQQLLSSTHHKDHVANSLADEGIQWTFIPPRAPHWGGNIQSMYQGFWKQWHQEYLTSLQQRPKWTKATPIIKIGSVVLVKESNTPPASWHLARVIE
ncbi:hypothetical protein KR074_000038, partial [Drosophila pseudoananassae]